MMGDTASIKMSECEEFLLDQNPWKYLLQLATAESRLTGWSVVCFSDVVWHGERQGPAKTLDFSPEPTRETPINSFLVWSYAGTTPTGEAPTVHISIHEFPTLGIKILF